MIDILLANEGSSHLCGFARVRSSRPLFPEITRGNLGLIGRSSAIQKTQRLRALSLTEVTRRLLKRVALSLGGARKRINASRKRKCPVVVVVVVTTAYSDVPHTSSSRRMRRCAVNRCIR